MGRNPRAFQITPQQAKRGAIITVLVIFLFIAMLNIRNESTRIPVTSSPVTPHSNARSQVRDDHLVPVKNVVVRRVAVRFTQSWMILDRLDRSAKHREKAILTLYQTATPQLAQAVIQSATQQRPTAYHPPNRFRLENSPMLYQTRRGKWSAAIVLSQESQPIYLDLQRTREGIKVTHVSL